jgi:hypothetical protein
MRTLGQKISVAELHHFNGASAPAPSKNLDAAPAYYIASQFVEKRTRVNSKVSLFFF